MSIIDLRISNLRNLQQVELNPSPGLNLLVGANGSGKSSALEAIYLLTRGKSFRTNRNAELIHYSAKSLTVAAQLQQVSSIHKMGIELAASKRELRLNGVTVQRMSDLAYQLPTQFIDPSSYHLLEAEPAKRRQFIDFGAFHWDVQFLPACQRYKKCLLQRNQLLKSGVLHGIDSWDQELAQYGGIITQIRTAYLLALFPLFDEFAKHFQISTDYQIQLRSGWDDQYPLLDVLQRSRETDARYGYTQYGPHKADFLLRADGRAAKSFMSRGQRKIIVLALMLAQINLMTDQNSNSACVLVDDFSAELDRENQDEFMRLLSLNQHQLFVTTTEQSLVQRYCDYQFKIFNINAGLVETA